MLGIDLKTARQAWTAALVVLLIGIIYVIRQTLFVFTISLLFAYLLYPLFDAIDRKLKTRSRTTALAITYLVVIAFIGGLGTFIGVHVSGEAGQLATQIRQPGFLEQVQRWHFMNLPVGQMISTHYQEIVTRIPSVTLKVLTVSTNLILVIIIPILSFLILKDGRHIRDSFLELFEDHRQTAEDTLLDVHTLLLQYMRALLFLCFSTLVVFSVVLSVMGVPYSILLAAIAFPLEFIPLVGPMVAAGIIVSVSLVSGAPVVGVVIFLAVFRVFQDYVLSPHLMSKGVELHPLLVIFGVFAGGEIGGVQGVFLSIPVLALLRLLYHRLRKSRVITPHQVALT